jgi:hypothetical protein
MAALTKTSGGMFGSSDTYNPSQMGFAGPGSGGASYSMVGQNQGMNMLNSSPGYQSKAYNPYQFSAPSYGSLGSYGTTSPDMMKNIQSTAFKAGSKPILDQSRERMRQMSQGFEGGRFGGAAQRTAAMREGQYAGEGLQDLSRTLSSNTMQSMLGEQQTARGMEYQDRGQVRDFNANTALQNQHDQSSANFQAADFGDQQSRAMSDDIMRRAQAMFGFGQQNTAQQAQLTQLERQAWENALSRLGTMSGI